MDHYCGWKILKEEVKVYLGESYRFLKAESRFTVPYQLAACQVINKDDLWNHFKLLKTLLSHCCKQINIFNTFNNFVD